MSINKDFIDGIGKKTLIHVGKNQIPTLLVIHYSVTNTVAEAVNALNSQNFSYHVLIEKNGTAFQTRPFTKTAAHSGLSNWKSDGGLTLGASVQRGSIGICLMNKGFAFDPGVKNAAGKLIYNPDDSSMQRWESYPAAQVASCRAIAKDIIAAYGIREVVGHHDIAIMGKFDPGPLFDLAALEGLISGTKPLGFKTKVKTSDGFLNLRRGPNGSFAVIEKIANGTTIHVRAVAYGSKAECIQPSPPYKKRYLTPWASVDVDGSNAHAGFVHMSGLEATPLVPALAAHL